MSKPDRADETKKTVINRLSRLQVRAVKAVGGTSLTQNEEDEIEQYTEDIMQLFEAEKQVYARELLTKLKEQAIDCTDKWLDEDVKAVPVRVIDKLIEENSDNE